MPNNASHTPHMNDDDRIDRFESAYNRIDQALAELIGEQADRRKHAFAAKVRVAASRQRRLAKYVDFLLKIGELRNAVVHNRTGEEIFVAVPSEATVLELERIEQQILAPERVEKKFLRKVLTLRPDQSLAEAFQMVRDDGYSRYPVYEKGRFVGMLTANGFTRWIAGQMNNSYINIDASKVRVADILERDHRRDRATFVSRNAMVDDVEQLFVKNQALEAVIVTEHGREDEQPIGMICPADIAR